MKITVNNRLFKSKFEDYGRGDQFSDEALDALFAANAECEEQFGVEVELDVIAICCDWTEYDHEDLVEEYGHLVEGLGFEDDEMVEALISKMERQTVLIRLTSGVLVMDY